MQLGYCILILDTYYRTFLGSLYRQQPHLADRPYADQLQVLLDACFGTADAYSSNLNAQGHKAAEVVVNAPLLQRRWACEHGLRIASRPPTVAIRRYRGLPVPRIKRDERWLYSVLIAQVKDYRPDVLYVQDIRWLPRQVLEQARADVRWVVGQHATTFLVPEQCRGYDLIVSSLPNQVAYFRRLGIPSEYLAIGFYAKVLSRLQPQSLETDVVHVGGYGRIHAERNELLSRVAREVPVDFWGYGVRNLPLRSPIRKRYRGEAWGLDMYQVRRNSRVVLTKHITAVAGNYANNCTLFETLRIWAYRARRQPYLSEELFRDAVLGHALSINGGFEPPLSHAEVRATAKSVTRWTWRNMSPQGFREHQRALGKRSGIVRRGRAMELRKRILETVKQCPALSQGDIAALHGVTRETVNRHLRAHKRGVT